MMPSPQEPDYSRADEFLPAAPAGDDASGRKEFELLEQVLRRTLLAADSGQPADGADVAAILAVARRHRGEPLSLEPVAVELVDAVIESHFGAALGPGERRRPMAERIAETLMEDPEARQRLERIWSGMGGATP